VITSPATIELPLRRTLVHSELYSALSNIFKFSIVRRAKLRDFNCLYHLH